MIKLIRRNSDGTYYTEDIGEEQLPYNRLFTINGTDDTAKVIIINTIPHYDSYSMVIDSNNNSYCIKEDSSERLYQYQQSPLYKHTIQLFDASNIANTWLLDSISFSPNMYNATKMFIKIKRFSNTNNIGIAFNTSNIDVDNISKAYYFDGYKVKTAIEEIANGLSMIPDYDYTTLLDNSKKYITIRFINRYGDTSITQKRLSVLQAQSQQLIIDNTSDGFATKVYSNMKNVLGTEVKYPNKTGVMLTTNSDTTLSNDNAKMLLPNNIDRINSIQIMPMIRLQKEITYDSMEIYDFNGYGKGFIEELEQKESDNDVVETITNKVTEYLKKYNNWTVYNEDSVPTSTSIAVYLPTTIGSSTHRLFLRNKIYRDLAGSYKDNTIYYSQKSNEINGFSKFDDTTYYSWKEQSGNEASETYYTYTITFYFSYKYCRFIINYIPLLNTKFMINNNVDIDREYNYSTIFNQSATIVDGDTAINNCQSYINNMISDNKTYQCKVSNYDSIYKCGTMIKDSDTNDIYVVSSVSINTDFDTNGKEIYLVQYVLNKDTSKRSDMISSDESIEDYTIPSLVSINRTIHKQDIVTLEYTKPTLKNSYLNVQEVEYLISNYDGIRKKYNRSFFKFVYEDDTKYFSYPCTTIAIGNVIFITTKFDDNNLLAFNRDVVNTFAWTEYTNDIIITPLSYTDSNGEINYYQWKPVLDTSGYIQNYLVEESDFTNAGEIFNVEDEEDYQEDFMKDKAEIPTFQYTLQVCDTKDIVMYHNNLLRQFTNDDVKFRIYETSETITPYKQNYTKILLKDDVLFTRIEENNKTIGVQYNLNLTIASNTTKNLLIYKHDTLNDEEYLVYGCNNYEMTTENNGNIKMYYNIRKV